MPLNAHAFSIGIQRFQSSGLFSLKCLQQLAKIQLKPASKLAHEVTLQANFVMNFTTANSGVVVVAQHSSPVSRKLDCGGLV